MNTSNISSRSASAGLFAAIVASLCCITPVFSLLAGIGGIAATFSWMEPFRPYLIALTIGVLGFAWYQKLRSRTAEEIACACEDNEKPSFWHSKRFLGIVTVFAAFMLAFPTYSHIFYSNGGSPQLSFVAAQDTTKTYKIILEIEGMTCAGCENHIEYEVGLLDGIKSVDASYATGSAIVEYQVSKIKEKTIIETIDKTGYTVLQKPKDQ
ncbi:mercuric transport protein MerTP [Ekhidna sp.]|uniref:mercuric transport protein MerTP n=1 Tax=Ekhidna sp. TaxID=2608089 RepID=UPI0032971E28